MSTSVRSKLIKVLSMVLVFSFVLSGCSKGGSSESKKNKKKTKNSEKKEEKYKDEIEDYWDVEDEADPPAEGDSEALSFSPCAGVHVNAKENQLNPDTEITFTSFDEDDDELAEVADILEEDGIYTLAAWEVDCGLESEEKLPGKYNVSLDLEYLDIDPDLYEDLSVFRVDDEGNYYEYNTILDGTVLRYSSNQNSAVVLGFVLAGVAGWAAHKEYKERNKYYYNSGKKVCTYDGKNDYGSFRIEWLMEDADPILGAKVKRAAEIEAEKQKEAQDFAKTFDALTTYRKAGVVESKYKELLKEDKEYQGLLKEMQETDWPFPESIDVVIRQVRTAFEYLGGKGFKMPLTKVVFKCIKSGPLGMAVNRTFSTSYIELNLNSFIECTQEQKDDLLLTVTHELFHLCQNRYRAYLTDTPRFDEMVCLIMEEDAYEDYKTSGKIVSTTLSLTPRNYYGSLRLPIDGAVSDSSVDEGELLGHEGYTLAGFVDYLRDHVNKGITAKNLMDARPYFKTATTTGPLSTAFGLTKAEVEKHFHDYIISIRAKIGDNLINEVNLKEYKFPAVQTLTRGAKIHYDPACEGSDSLTINTLVQENIKIPILVVADEDSALNRGNLDLVPTRDYQQVKNGYYIAPLEKYNSTDLYTAILEIYGDVTDKTNLKPGYTVWGLAEPEKPEITYEKETNSLKVVFGKKTAAAEAKVIEGYALTLKGNNGVEYTEYFPIENIDNEQTIDFTNVRPPEQVSNTITVTANLSEYVTNEKGEKLLSIPSQDLVFDVIGEFYDTCAITLTYGGEINSYSIV
ncbi:MAG: hypothetical protein J6040_01875, partial [Clostridiales bacterium]|nr:hypothetical protein [Clostridiales bacterium]